jgi:hypothetical protein
MKKASILMVLILTVVLLAACGGKAKEETSPSAPAAAPAVTAAPAKATTLMATVINSSGYVFQELYVSPTAANDWGDDHLGSTSLLKKGGSFDITLPAYDFNTYDIRIIDEDEDAYLFERVPLSDGCSIDITWETDLVAVVSGGSGEGAAVTGMLESASSGSDTSSDASTDTSSSAAVDTWYDLEFYNDTSFYFSDLYLFDSGATDESQIGYNHIESIGGMVSEETVTVGVDALSSYGVLLLDEDGDEWYYTGVYLEDGAYVSVYLNSGTPELNISYLDGTYLTYEGVIN